MVLLFQYHNLNKVMQVCGKEVRNASKIWDGNVVSHLVLHVILYIMWALEHEMVSPAGITMEWLDKARGGTSGALRCWVRSSW